MHPTPKYASLTKTDFQNVYEPAEDTFLFLDALDNELDYLNKINPLVACEIGCGTGLAITYLAKYLKKTNNTAYFAVDINNHACLATKKVSNENNINLNVINSDLVFTFEPRLSNKIDILLFNAPYVVTESHEIGNFSDVSAAWAGGVNGREVMSRLFPFVSKLLSPCGVFYLVCIKQNQIDFIENELKTYGLKMEIVLNRKTLIENLFVLKFFK